MNAAVPAERVFRGLRAELIGRELAFAGALKLLRRHDQMQKALHAAERAVAINGLIEIAADAEREGLVARWGRKVLEVRPPIDAHKGTGVVHLLDGTGLRRAMFAGDDLTDLDGFGAMEQLAAATTYAQWFVPAYVNLAELQRQGGDEVVAEQTLRRGLGAVPDNPELLYALGLSVYRQQRPAESVVLLGQAAKVAPPAVRSQTSFPSQTEPMELMMARRSSSFLPRKGSSMPTPKSKPSRK